MSQARAPRRDVFVVLDDDPTGTQPVGNVPVLTAWTREDLRWALDTGDEGFYVLTNTRALTPAETADRVEELTSQIVEVAAERNVQAHFVSRGDSTLRGHFPLEVDTIRNVLHRAGREVGLVILAPAYPRAGRVTRGGIHYAGGERPITVSETEFARDATFGFRHAELCRYIEEKSSGRVPADDVVVIHLDEFQGRPVSALADRFLALAQRGTRTWATIDAATEGDLQHIGAAIRRALSLGAQIVCQSGPGLMPALLRQEPAATLTDLSASTATPKTPTNHGLIVVGSHVSVTTRQLGELLTHAELVARHCEVEVSALTDPSTRASAIQEAVRSLSAALREGNAVLSTTRQLQSGTDPEDSLHIARSVSAGLVEIVRATVERTPPSFVIAKGGITSSDIATQALDISRATVLGPLLPGLVSAWLPHTGPLTGHPYVVFAGNVGETSALVDVVFTLTQQGIQ